MPGSDEALLHYMSFYLTKYLESMYSLKLLKVKKLLGVFQKYDIIGKIRG